MSASPTVPASTRHAATPTFELNWWEFGFLVLLLAGGFAFLRDAPFWGAAAYIGHAQFGDAQFWWDGALHFSQGIVADNPNLTFRMGYAAFGGLVTAVLGPDYHVFHGVLVAIFLATTAGVYLSLRAAIGRLAAAAAALFFVFNPFTAEWLAISTSDALGLVLNLVALLALVAGVAGRLRLRWIAVFGIFFASASLTRPLMTPFIAAAGLAIVAAGWGDWRKLGTALVVLAAAFVLPTLSWMGFMAATTGNFALTGVSQDSSAFYAASDPQIQTWNDVMYDPVVESARRHYGTAQPTAKQLNAEFWLMTRSNYQKNWRYHVTRLWQNTFELARFTPARSAVKTPGTESGRIVLQWALAIALGAACMIRRQWLAGRVVLSLGILWALWPASQPWLVLTAGLLGLGSLFLGRRDLFVWTAYWWVGVAALYLTGGTWGPPKGPVFDLNALGYRLGFQFLSLGDLLVIGLLGVVAWPRKNASPAFPLEPQPAPLAGRFFRIGLVGFLGALCAVLGTGAAVVAQRMVTRARLTPVPYPDPAPLAALPATHHLSRFAGFDPLRTAINVRAGEPLLASAMSSGFIWNLAGQERCWVLLYQQDNVQPVQMSPRIVYVEVARHLPERTWMHRQGAWVLRSFPNLDQRANLPYYIELPAVQAFVPLAPDGKSYDLSAAVVFPLAKTATQLAAAGHLTIEGAVPNWTPTVGLLKYPRRFSLRVTEPDQTIRLQVSLAQALGARSLRFGVAVDCAPDRVARSAPVHLRLTEADSTGRSLKEADLVPNHPEPLNVVQAAPDKATALGLTVTHLQPGDTLWFYELGLEADDFRP